jgi:hypothetical protein
VAAHLLRAPWLKSLLELRQRGVRELGAVKHVQLSDARQMRKCTRTTCDGCLVAAPAHERPARPPRWSAAVAPRV